MLKIGLTGGIGSGKSTAAALFAQRGACVIDADLIARELVTPGSPALEAVVKAFGSQILLPDGRLDRSQLRQRIFSDPKAKRILEAILHPLIFAEMQRRAELCQTPYCILVIPLLVESKAQNQVDRVLVVDCPQALQIERVKQRDRIPEEQILNILASQATRQQRLNAADEVIFNAGTLTELEKQVEELHRFYARLSSGCDCPRPL